MNTTMTDIDNTELQRVLRDANRVWRRAGVRRADRSDMLAELEAEIVGAQRDGHELSAVLGDDSTKTLRQWADERQLSGRALRMELIVPAALFGIVVGLSVVLMALYAGFSNGSTFDVGTLLLPLYASAGLTAYLCALVSVRLVLARDPHMSSTIRRLALTLPAGALAAIGGGVAVAWWRNFDTSTSAFAAVISLVIVILATSIAVARFLAVRSAVDEHSKNGHSKNEHSEREHWKDSG